ncbi:MAG: hypothetical protein IPN01_15620 [Deltaproteobacteria bacterium]|nr:hypothetical protein [Deltaproteobacteria bacterium]
MASLMFWCVMWIGLIPSALAQSSMADTALQRVEGASRAYDDGQLTDAARLAQEAVSADPSNVTAQARRVLVEVALREGDLDAADALITELQAVPFLRPALVQWATRAAQRAQIERLESSGDAQRALTLLAALPAASFDDWEQTWLSRLTWRLPLRAMEQQRRLREAKAAIQAEQRREALTEDDRRWLTGAARRVEVLTQVQSCAPSTARALASDMAQDTTLRPADRAWARLEIARGELRALQDDPDALALPLASFMAQSQGSPAHHAWGQGLQATAELRRLHAEGDAAALAARSAALTVLAESWRAGEPPCAAPSTPIRSPEGRRPLWAQLALSGSQEAWSLRVLSELPAASLCERPCVSPTLAVSARGGVTIVGPLGVAAGATFSRPLQRLVVGDAPPILSSAWLGLGYVGPQRMWLVGPRLYTSLLIQGSVKAPDASRASLPFAQVTGRWSAPSSGLDAQMNLGTNLLSHLVELDLGWRQGDTDAALRIGVSAGLVTGRWAVLDTHNNVYPTQQQDWRVGLSVGADWERP